MVVPILADQNAVMSNYIKTILDQVIRAFHSVACQN